jgi:hypothetical protein
LFIFVDMSSFINLWTANGSPGIVEANVSAKFIK